MLTGYVSQHTQAGEVPGEGERTMRLEKVRAFAQELIDTRRGLRWRPFIRREDVRVELFARGYELIEDGDDWNPLLLRFYAIDHAAARASGPE